MEGTLTGTFNELTTLNGIPLTPEEQIGLIFKHGGLKAWGNDQLAPHLLRRMGLGRQHPVRLGQASRLAPRRHPEPDGRVARLAQPERSARLARRRTEVPSAPST